MSSFHLPPALAPLDLSKPVAKYWASIVANHSPATIDFVGTSIVQLLFFWVPSAIYLSLETLFPAFSERHKIQPAPKQPTRAELWDCLTVVLRNQIMSSALHMGLLYIGTLTGHNAFRVEPTLPSVFEIARDIAVSLVIREALFYYSHRLLHHPRLYPKIHKIHHRFTAPVALAAQYAHPLEQIVANILPITLPPQIMHSHVITFWIFMAFELLETTTVHSGYDFFKNLAKKHDLHHEKFLIHFGAILGVFDWFHGTDGSKMMARRKAKGANKQVDAVAKENKTE